jgi:hypothetical protein
MDITGLRVVETNTEPEAVRRQNSVSRPERQWDFSNSCDIGAKILGAPDPHGIVR